MRIALGLEYLGSQYFGWQKQIGHPTIQETLEKALSQVADHPVTIFSAGRTDTGVHASAQVVHFDTTAQRRDLAWTFGVNSLMPDSIRVQWIKAVPDSFHARFSAMSRSYRYIIHNSRVKSAILSQQMTWHPIPLDVTAMQEAAQYLIGRHDFTSYRSSDCQAHSPVRNLMICNVIRKGDLVIIEVKANGFLHHMVRNLAGVLVKIGEAKMPPEWAREVLLARDRRAAAKMLGPDGLYLTEIGYPQEYQLPLGLPGPVFLHIV
ncbi:MAG: tRNA pseudouridine(38-40) synthase TruA [Gammaproteobacteria bacterium]|nr:tRNA pseudouridine(38-40) synthase TruA [Gammaproteobacteria bacterium]